MNLSSPRVSETGDGDINVVIDVAAGKISQDRPLKVRDRIGLSFLRPTNAFDFRRSKTPSEWRLNGIAGPLIKRAKRRRSTISHG